MPNYSAADHAFVICAYKESPYLRDCVRSLLAQSVKGDICMATSTPNEYIRGVCGEYGIPLFVNPEAKGIAADWNFAYAQAPGRALVTIIHQDDIYEPDYLKEVLRRAGKQKRPLIIHTDSYEMRDGEKIRANFLLIIKRVMNIPLLFMPLQRVRWVRRCILAFGDSICCPSVTYVRPNLPSPLFDTRFVNSCDYRAWVDISPLMGAFVYCPKKLTGHRIYADSTTSANIGNRSRDREDISILSSLWPAWAAKLIYRFYRNAQNSNQ